MFQAKGQADKGPGFTGGGLASWWMLAAMCLPEEPEGVNSAEHLHSFIQQAFIEFLLYARNWG